MSTSVRASRWDPAAAGPWDSWLFLTIAATYPLVQFVRTVLDRSVLVYDATGTVHYLSEGNARQLMQLGLGGLALVLAVQVLLHLGRQGQVRLTSWSFTALLMLVAALVRRDDDLVAMAYTGLASILLLAVGHARLTAETLSRIGAVVALTAGANLLFAAVDPLRGWGECRTDKCSLAGGLLRGFFPQENVIGVFFAALLPSIAYIRHPAARRLSFALAIACVVLSGSRTGLASLALGLWVYILVRRRADPGRPHGDAAKVLGVLPLVLYIASFVLVLLLDDDGLTGRGLIFRIVREAWVDDPVLGAGRGALEDAYYSGAVNWFIAHEHSEGGYILASAGIVGAVALLVSISSVTRACWTSGGPMPAGFAVVVSLGFLTEPTWEFTLQSPFFLTLALTAALVAATFRGEAPPTPSVSGCPDLPARARRAPDVEESGGAASPSPGTQPSR